MRRIGALAAAALLASGCLHVQTQTHVTRGPLLRTFERKQRSENAGVLATVQPSWPKLTVDFRAYDLCRTEQVGRYSETRVTESHSPGAGPALSSGVSITLLGAALYLAKGLFSNAPNTGHLDESGHYGASARQKVAIASYVLMALGVPAIVTGAVGLLRSGRDVKKGPVDEVLGTRQAPCHEQPVDGRAAFLTANGLASAEPTAKGQATWTADALGRDFTPEGIQLSDRTAKLSPKDEASLRAYAACVQLLAGSSVKEVVASVTNASSAERLALMDHAQRCDAIPGKPAAEVEKALRTAPPGSGAPKVQSWEQAEALHPPRLELMPGSSDFGKLSSAPDGTAAHLEGVVEARVDEELLRIRVDAGHALLLVVPPDAVWNTGFSTGDRVEGIALTAGHLTSGGAAYPRLRAVWLRRAF